MRQKEKLQVNTVLPLINMLCLTIIGIIVPKLIIVNYGSEINGTISSITYFTSIMTLLDMGIGAVVQASLYKPLAENDADSISKIYKSSSRFFWRITIILIIFSAAMSFAYPLIVKTSMSFFITALLVVAVSFNGYSKNYLGITKTILLNAHEKIYISMTLNIICAVIGFVLSVLLIKSKVSIIAVEMAPAVAFIIKPILLDIYIKRHYVITKNIDISEEPIKQKWNGVAQHLSFYITTNVDVIIITLLISLKEVSVYSVYNMIVSGISGLIIVLQSGVQPILGRLYASGKSKELSEFFEKYEFLVHIITTMLFSCTISLIIPFVSVYTLGIKDANYIRPAFAAVFCLAQFFYSLRFPYHTMVIAAGHFKQTQLSSIVEMLINLVLTIALSFRFGLIGVVLGTLVSLAYKFFYLLLYTKRIVTDYAFRKGIRLFLSDAISISVSALICFNFSMQHLTYFNWIILAVEVSVISIVTVVAINLVVNKSRFIMLLKSFLSRGKLIEFG